MVRLYYIVNPVFKSISGQKHKAARTVWGNLIKSATKWSRIWEVSGKRRDSYSQISKRHEKDTKISSTQWQKSLHSTLIQPQFGSEMSDFI